MPTNPDPDLMRIFDFEADDLESNRAGKISTNQGQRLLNIAKSEKEDTGCLESLMFPFYVVLGSIVLKQFAGAGKIDQVLYIFIIVILVLVAVINLRGIYLHKRPLEEDVLLGKIAYAEGRCSLLSKNDNMGLQFVTLMTIILGLVLWIFRLRKLFISKLKNFSLQKAHFLFVAYTMFPKAFK